MVYSVPDIAALYGVSVSTTTRHIKKAKTKGFIKKSMGKFYTDEDVEELSRLLGFHFTLK